MNKTVRVSLIVVIAVGLLLALTISGLAKKPDDKGKPDTFTLTYEFPDVNWEIYYAEGTFDLETTGGSTASGTAILHWVHKYGTQFGTMIITAIEEGNVIGTAVFNFKLPPTNEDCASGPVTMPLFGTGVFESYQGTGDIYMCREKQDDGTFMLYGYISGWVEKMSSY